MLKSRALKLIIDDACLTPDLISLILGVMSPQKSVTGGLAD